MLWLFVLLLHRTVAFDYTCLGHMITCMCIQITFYPTNEFQCVLCDQNKATFEIHFKHSVDKYVVMVFVIHLSYCLSHLDMQLIVHALACVNKYMCIYHSNTSSTSPAQAF